MKLEMTPQPARAKFLLALLACTVGAPPSVADVEDPQALAMRFGAASKQNAEALRGYSWTMRSAVTVKGEAKPAKLYHVRFDVDGKMQKTQLNAPAGQPQAQSSSRRRGRRRGGIRGRIQEKKIAETREWAGELAGLVARYTHPTPGTMLDFFARASFARLDDGSLRAEAEGFLEAGDRARFRMDPETGALYEHSFVARLEDDIVEGRVELRKLADGTTYAARTTIKLPGKQVEAVVENFDHEPSN